MMKIDDYVNVIAGIMITIITILGLLFSKYWLIGTIFIGLNLFQYGFTKFCPLKILLKKLGVK